MQISSPRIIDLARNGLIDPTALRVRGILENVALSSNELARAGGGPNRGATGPKAILSVKCLRIGMKVLR